MSQNFIACGRDQELLLPPSLREWLPEDDLAWFVLEAVAELDLDAFLAPIVVTGGARGLPSAALDRRSGEGGQLGGAAQSSSGGPIPTLAPHSQFLRGSGSRVMVIGTSISIRSSSIGSRYWAL